MAGFNKRKAAAGAGAFALILGIATAGASNLQAATTASGGVVTVTGVATNNSSVKIKFAAVPGAADYRAYDTANPTSVKYAGIVHPSTNGKNTSVPNTEIEWNDSGDGKAHTIVVQAVDKVGPTPGANMYNPNTNLALVNPLPATAMLGANRGATDDGLSSTNGQGPSTNKPNVIATSAPFVIQTTNSKLAIPSSSAATQTFFDTFDNAEGATLKTTSASDPQAQTVDYSLNAGTDKAWIIKGRAQDVKDSMVMIKGDHFMNVNFDGGTPGSSNPLHVSQGVLAMQPDKSFDFSGGKVLHITYEVDNHQGGRRWMSVLVTPTGDTPISFDLGNGTSGGSATNKSNTGVDFELRDGGCSIGQLEGDSKTKDPNVVGLLGAAGQAKNYCGERSTGIDSNGRGLDDRSRVDLYLSSTNAAIYEDGVLAGQTALDKSLPFSSANVSFAHHVYDTNSEVHELKDYAPEESYWINSFQHSDERHWDNMGAEVLPATTDFKSFASISQPPAFVAVGSGSVTPITAPATTSTTMEGMPGMPATTVPVTTAPSTTIATHPSTTLSTSTTVATHPRTSVPRSTTTSGVPGGHPTTTVVSPMPKPGNGHDGHKKRHHGFLHWLASLG